MLHNGIVLRYDHVREVYSHMHGPVQSDVSECPVLCVTHSQLQHWWVGARQEVSVKFVTRSVDAARDESTVRGRGTGAVQGVVWSQVQ